MTAHQKTMLAALVAYRDRDPTKLYLSERRLIDEMEKKRHGTLTAEDNWRLRRLHFRAWAWAGEPPAGRPTPPVRAER